MKKKASSSQIRRPKSPRRAGTSDCIPVPEGENPDVFPLIQRIEALCSAVKNTPCGLEPDWPKRLQGLRLLLAYREGLPIPRKEIPKAQPTSSESVKDLLINNPRSRQAFRDYIDWIEQQAEASSREEEEDGDLDLSTDDEDETLYADNTST